MSRASLLRRPRWFTACRLSLATAIVGALLPVATASASSGTYYISPAGAGARDGSSWADAATLSALPRLVKAAGPGGQVLLLAGQGDYTSSVPLGIRAGGADGEPVTVRGATADGGPAAVTVRGTRTSPYSGTGNPGGEVFRLLQGADHLSFQHLSFVNVGNGAIRVGADVADLDIEHVTGTNVRRLLEDEAAGTATSATISGLTMRDVTVMGFSRSVLRLQYDTHAVLAEDVTGNSERQDGDEFAIGVQLSGTVHDVVLRRVSISDCTDTTNSYWNGDGFAAEEGTYALRLEDTQAIGNTDAGYDIKSDDVTMTRPVAIDNKRNYRLWGRNIELDQATALDPHLRGGSGSQAEFWIGPKAQARISDSAASDASRSTVVYELEPGSGQLAVDGGSVTLNSAARLAKVGTGSTLTDGTATVQRVF